jgi:hypothetical protein
VKGWFHERYRHYLAAKGIETGRVNENKVVLRYFQLQSRMSVEDREKYIRGKLAALKNIPEDKKSDEDVHRLVELSEGLGKQGVDDVLFGYGRDFEPIDAKAKREGFHPEAVELGESLWRGIGGSDVETFASVAKRDREFAEANERALLGFVPDGSNRRVWNSLLRNPESFELWGGKGHPELSKTIKKIYKYHDADLNGAETWAVVDEEGKGAWVDFYPRSGKVEMNSPFAEEEESESKRESGKSGKKEYFYKVEESDFERQRRLRAGYKDVVEVDAEKLKKAFERDQREDLVWSDDRLRSARERGVVDSYPRIFIGKGIDFEDGRHRVAAAAEKGEVVKVAVHDKNKFLERLGDES